MLIKTAHGEISTPVFMPVGTAATVKALSPQDLIDMEAQIILSNNYHLYLHPGSKQIKNMGGIHKFMGWNYPILTDSGGFQIQSLSKEEVGLCKIDDDGVTFRSHLDGGTLHRFTPEIATKSQIDIGADIIMAFDDSVPENASRSRTELAVKRTHAWLLRCIKVWNRNSYLLNHNSQLFGIIQGGVFKDLLRESAKFVVSLDLPGVAIGGAVIGSDPIQTAETIAMVKDLLPKDKPLYAMGVGVRPSDLISVIKAGADMFDCVAPSRLARTGLLYHPDSKNERIDISKHMFKLDKKILVHNCDCYTCTQGFSRAYLHHLFKSKELLYYRLATIHNLRTMIRTAKNYGTANRQ